VSIIVKLSRIERLLNAAPRVPIHPKPDDPYLAKVKTILAEERAEGCDPECIHCAVWREKAGE
jgi:hypothetical protein